MAECRPAPNGPEVPDVPFVTIWFLHLEGVTYRDGDRYKIYDRMKRDMAFFEKVSTVSGGCWPRCVLHNPTGFGGGLVAPYNNSIINSEEIDLAKSAPEAITYIRNYLLGLEDAFRPARCNMDVIVIYIPGLYFNREGKETNTRGIAYNQPGRPYVILICEGANERILSHEIGHVLNYSNRNGNINDLDPDPDDPAHNKNPGNLMYKEAGDSLTLEQISKFCESLILWRPN